MQFNDIVSTTKKTKGTNTKQYIVVHHTGNFSYPGNLNFLSTGDKPASVHYVVGPKGEIGKIGEHNDILWHAGISEWEGKKDLNRYSIGIEVCSDGFIFTDIQKKKVKELIEYIMKQEGIKKENVLRHVDISGPRKRDIGPNFWDGEYSSWTEYQNSLNNNNIPMSLKQVITAVINLNSFLYDNIENEELRKALNSVNTILRTLV